MTDCWTNLLKVRRSERRRHPTLCSQQPALPARPSRRQRQSNTQQAAFNITAETSTGTVWEMRQREGGGGWGGDRTKGKSWLRDLAFLSLSRQAAGSPLAAPQLPSLDFSPKKLLLEGCTSTSSSLHLHPFETKEASRLLIQDDCRIQNEAGNNINNAHYSQQHYFV